MNIDRNRRTALLSWLFVGVVFALCGVLGVLQYRWIGEVSVASRERLRASLQSSVVRLSQEFNTEITSACRSVLPAGFNGAGALEEELRARYVQWKATSRHVRLFERIAIAAPREGSVALRSLDLETGAVTDAEWPPAWKGVKDRLELWLSPDAWQNRGAPGRRPEYTGAIFEVPLFAMPKPGTPPVPFGHREGAWVIFEFNPRYACDVILSELMRRHLGAGGNLDYQVEVLTKARTPSVVYQSDPEHAKDISSRADASASLLELRYDRLFRRSRFMGERERGEGPPRPPERSMGPDLGRWQIFVRHRAGSLDAVVTRARWRNVAVTAGILLLMLASVAALIRFTQRAQRLAELQMGFVAGVSHELRTPLTVIHTAAYNLRGRLAQNPAQVERYGTLIQQESGRLKELVEQVLGFAGAQAGRMVKEREPLCVSTLIEQCVESSRPVLQANGCVVEKNLDTDLPLVLGDPLALKQVIQNLLSNAAKYGTEGSNWIGIFAGINGDKDRPEVEIRVADRGPGIPADEQEHVFDAFFRGRRAVQDQVHGTGLGLNLVKKIVEAHGGSIRLRSEPMKGTEFTVRIPAAPPECVDEFADSAGRG